MNYSGKYVDVLKVARERLRLNINSILSKLDNDEWVSLIFLVYDENNAYSEAFRNIIDISRGNIDKVVSCLCNSFQSSDSTYETSFDPIIESLYRLSRFDILEDDLGFCTEHSLHQICPNLNSLFIENQTLFQVFSSLTQDEANQLISLRLRGWHSQQLDEMFEILFLRNLDPKRKTYMDLIRDLYQALLLEEMDQLANLLRPFVWMKPSRSSEDVPSSPLGIDPSDYYPMPTSEPHGLCVVINVSNFIEPRGPEDDFPLETRRGSDLDRDLVEGTFKLFGFKVLFLDNPDYDAFCAFFTKLRKNVGMYTMSCLAVFVMTHGDKEDNIYLSDRKCLAVTDLRRLCYARSLIGKPKMFFVQACRGEENLTPMLLKRDGTVTSNTESDCVISMATVGRHAAIRSQSSGSWYISDLCASLQEIGHVKPLKTVLNVTRQRLSDRLDQFRGMYVTQISEDKFTLTKEIQLKRSQGENFAEGVVDLVALKVFLELIDCIVSDAVDDGVLTWPYAGNQAASLI